MTSPNIPHLYKNLLPEKPETSPEPPGSPKKKGKKKVQEDSEPTAYELAVEELANLGPILVRARTIHDNYVLTLKTEFEIEFNRAGWLSAEDINFLTVYRQTANGWVVTDICVDDISTVSITLPPETAENTQQLLSRASQMV